MKLIYIVEDHQVIREGVRRYLELAGYKVLSFGNLASVREAFRITKADLLIQDVMLPDGDGFEFVKELRKSIDIPVIFMTARIAEEDRLHGFELGADDYISKPFSPKELVMRVQAIFRRIDGGREADKGHKYSFKAESGTLCYDEIEHKVTIDGNVIALMDPTQAGTDFPVFNDLFRLFSLSVNNDVVTETADYCLPGYPQWFSGTLEYAEN